MVVQLKGILTTSRQDTPKILLTRKNVNGTLPSNHYQVKHTVIKLIATIDDPAGPELLILTRPRRYSIDDHLSDFTIMLQWENF